MVSTPTVDPVAAATAAISPGQAYPRDSQLDKLIEELIAKIDALAIAPDAKRDLIAELRSAAATGNISSVRAALANVSAQMESAKADAGDDVARAIDIADDLAVANFAAEHSYHATTLQNFNRLFPQLGSDSNMLHMVGEIGNHATADEREGLSTAKNQHEFGVVLGTITGQKRLSELAKHEAGMGRLKEALLEMNTPEAKQAAHYISLQQAQVHEYNAAIARGDTPADRLVQVPLEIQNLRFRDYKENGGTAALAAAFTAAYSKYAERRSAELTNAAADLPAAERAALEAYAQQNGIDSNKSDWLFSIRQHMQLNHANLPSAQDAYAKRTKGETLSTADHAVLVMSVTNDMYGNAGSAQLLGNVVRELEQKYPDAAVRERVFYNQPPEAKMAFIEHALSGGVIAPNEKAALRVYLEALKTPADYGALLNAVNESDKHRDPTIVMEYLSGQMKGNAYGDVGTLKGREDSYEAALKTRFGATVGVPAHRKVIDREEGQEPATNAAPAKPGNAMPSPVPGVEIPSLEALGVKGSQPSPAELQAATKAELAPPATNMAVVKAEPGVAVIS